MPATLTYPPACLKATGTPPLERWAILYPVLLDALQLATTDTARPWNAREAERLLPTLRWHDGWTKGWDRPSAEAGAIEALGYWGPNGRWHLVEMISRPVRDARAEADETACIPPRSLAPVRHHAERRAA